MRLAGLVNVLQTEDYDDFDDGLADATLAGGHYEVIPALRELDVRRA